MCSANGRQHWRAPQNSVYSLAAAPIPAWFTWSDILEGAGSENESRWKKFHWKEQINVSCLLSTQTFLDRASAEVCTICKYSLKLVTLWCYDLENKYRIVEWMSCRFFPSLPSISSFLHSGLSPGGVLCMWHQTEFLILYCQWKSGFTCESMGAELSQEATINTHICQICGCERGWRPVRTLSSSPDQLWRGCLSCLPTKGRCGSTCALFLPFLGVLNTGSHFGGLMSPPAPFFGFSE